MMSWRLPTSAELAIILVYVVYIASRIASAWQPAAAEQATPLPAAVVSAVQTEYPQASPVRSDFDDRTGTYRVRLAGEPGETVLIVSDDGRIIATWPQARGRRAMR